MTILAVQCRLSSSRLPGKALLPLGGKTVLDWTLSAMRKVPADAYYVATDESSYQALLPFCERNGFRAFKGPLDDVLERYCLLVEETGADAVIRATADNPFLFYEAAAELSEQYKRRSETSRCDYITFTGLPHGSGVEMFSARSLLEARRLSSSPYDREHVGPALYNHPESFRSVMLPAPAQWSRPECRTTIDTPADYRRALAIVRNVSGAVRGGGGGAVHERADSGGVRRRERGAPRPGRPVCAEGQGDGASQTLPFCRAHARRGRVHPRARGA